MGVTADVWIEKDKPATQGAIYREKRDGAKTRKRPCQPDANRRARTIDGDRVGHVRPSGTTVR